MSPLLSRISKHRRLWSAALILLFLFAAMPHSALAQETTDSCGTYWPCIADLVADGVYIFIWFWALVAGVIIAIQSWFLQIILSISFDIVNSTPVRTGFPIVLSITNLAFVAILITIAIATIIRKEQYGAKKTLWKLVFMAVMVNFGLVICGILLTPAHELAKFFIESISPSASGPGGTTNYRGFADSFAGAFNPKAMIVSQADVAANPALSAQSLGGVNATNSAGGAIGNLIKPFVAILAAFGSFVIIIITLATLTLMLLWRYVRLGIALILLPISWASWILPAYSDSNKKWWTKFTQWAIFPPVVIFFIWLGLKISEVMNSQDAEYALIYQVGPGDNPVSKFLGDLFTPVISQSLRAFILFGIMMSGMVAAQELGVKFADAGYKAIEGAGKGAKTWAGNKAKKGGVWTAGKAKGGAIRTAGWSMRQFEKVKVPGFRRLSQKKVTDASGKETWVDKTPEERQSGILKAKADKNRDDLAERLNPGSSLKRRRNETVPEWQARLAKRDKDLAVEKKPEENEDDWKERFRKGAAELAVADPGLVKKPDESFEEWQTRILAANPKLKRKAGTEETVDHWQERMAKEMYRRQVEEQNDRKKKGDRGLLASVWHGATSGFSKGAGHKHLSRKELDKLLHDLGVSVPHDEHPEPAGGGDAGGGGGEAHH